MIKSKKIALALSAIMFLQPAMFAVDSALTKEIVALEVELTKMKTHTLLGLNSLNAGNSLLNFLDTHWVFQLASSELEAEVE